MFGFSKKKFQVNLAPRKKAPPPTAPPKSPSIAITHKVFLLFLLCVFLLAIFFTTLPDDFFDNVKFAPYDQTREGKTEEGLPVATSTTIEQIVTEVNKQYLLPTGETPTMALITSLEELKGQDFFAKAEVGDVVLMYMEAKKGILWRPRTRQVIEIGPILTKSSPEGGVATTTGGTSEKTAE